MSKVSIQNVGGAGAILAPLFLLPWFAFPKIAPFLQIHFPQSLDLEAWARLKVEHHMIITAVDWSVILSLAFETAAAVAFFYALRHAEPLTWIGIAAWVTGLHLIFVEHVIVLAVDASLMPKYLAADMATRPAVEVLASTLNRIRLIAATVGNHLILGVAVPIFAAASFRISRVPKWVRWLGIAVGICTWLPLRFWPPPAFVGFMVWMVAMGVIWLRLDRTDFPGAGS